MPVCRRLEAKTSEDQQTSAMFATTLPQVPFFFFSYQLIGLLDLDLGTLCVRQTP